MPAHGAVRKLHRVRRVLAQHQIPHNLDRDGYIAELQVNAPPLPGNIYVKWEKELPIFTFIQFMIENVPPARIRDLETAIGRLNTVMEVGGFCYDYRANRVFCRFSVPLFDGISAQAFQRTFELVVSNARGFTPLFRKVVDGAAGEDIEKLALEYAATLKGKPAPVTLPQ